MGKFQILSRSILVIVLSFFLISSSTTTMNTVESLQDGQAAVIKNIGDGNAIEIDGKSVSEGKTFLPRTLELSAGEHYLTLRYMHYSPLPKGEEIAVAKNYKFNFIAGKTYVVKYALSENEARPQISQSANTEILLGSSSSVYAKNWSTKIVWLWIEEKVK